MTRRIISATRESVVKGRCAFLIAGLAIAGSIFAGTPASARPVDKGHFDDVFTGEVYDCDGIRAQDSGDVSGNFVFNERGSSPFPYFRESIHGTVVTTNLDTGGTYTNVFTSNSRDQRSSTTATAPSRSPSSPPAAPASTTPTASSCSATPARVGSPSTSTTTALPVTPATTSMSLTRSESSAPPPGTATSRGATSARTWRSSRARRHQSTRCPVSSGQRLSISPAGSSVCARQVNRLAGPSGVDGQPRDAENRSPARCLRGGASCGRGPSARVRWTVSMISACRSLADRSR